MRRVHHKTNTETDKPLSTLTLTSEESFPNIACILDCGRKHNWPRSSNQEPVLTGTFEYLGLINSIFPLYCGLNIFGLTASSHYNLSFVIVLLSIFLLYVEK